MAVAFHPDFDYVALGDRRRRRGSRLHRRRRTWPPPSPPPANWAPPELARFKGSQLDRVTFQHPFLDRSILGVLATYVTADTGTGAVHTAPSHGADDFYTGQRYGLDHTCRVDAARPHPRRPGAWNHAAPPAFEGKTVWAANPVIVAMLEEPAHCWPRTTWNTPTRTAGAATSRSSTAPPSSGSSALKLR